MRAVSIKASVHQALGSAVDMAYTANVGRKAGSVTYKVVLLEVACGDVEVNETIYGVRCLEDSNTSIRGVGKINSGRVHLFSEAFVNISIPNDSVGFCNCFVERKVDVTKMECEAAIKTYYNSIANATKCMNGMDTTCLDKDSHIWDANDTVKKPSCYSVEKFPDCSPSSSLLENNQYKASMKTVRASKSLRVLGTSLFG